MSNRSNLPASSSGDHRPLSQAIPTARTGSSSQAIGELMTEGLTEFWSRTAIPKKRKQEPETQETLAQACRDGSELKARLEYTHMGRSGHDGHEVQTAHVGGGLCSRIGH